MYLRTLGGLHLQESGFRHPKLLLLLAYLTLEGPKDRRFLAELFWPQAANHMNSLARALADIRRAHQDIVQADSQQARTAIDSDVKEIIEKLNSGAYEQAIELYKAPFLENFYLHKMGEEIEEWIYATREYLADRIQGAALNLAEQKLQEGDLNSSVNYAEYAYKLEGLATSEPEVLKRLYSILSYGNSPFAKQVLKEAESFGLSLQDVQEFTPQRSTQQVTHNLPNKLTSYIGRDAELAELDTLLSEEPGRLITVTGLGGIGKTRFALEVARQQLSKHKFIDGIYFVALESLNEEKQIADKIAEAIKLVPKGSEPVLEQIGQFIEQKSILLVLDNFEHLIRASYLLTELLSTCPQLHCLITSREALHLQEESLFELDGLPYPEIAEPGTDQTLGYDAVKLFVERALKVQRNLQLIVESPNHIIEICHLLGGSPLALEMAASWIRIMSVAEIVQELKSSLKDLGHQISNVPQRHQSIKATFEYSWSLLTAKEQATLAKLSVFRGGFNREAAQAVGDLTIPQLLALIDKSLLQRVNENRYDLHPLIQEFCHEKLKALEDAKNIKEKHATYYNKLASDAFSQLRGAQQKNWVTRLSHEHENLLEALSFAQKSNSELGLSLAVALDDYWEIKGHYQLGLEWLKTLLPSVQVDNHGLRAKATFVVGRLELYQGNYRTAKEFLRESLHSVKQTSNMTLKASILNNLAVASSWQGKYEDARNLFEEGLNIRRQLGDQQGVAASLNNIGIILCDLGSYAEAKLLFEESLSIRRQLSDHYGIALTLVNLGNVMGYLGDNKQAKLYFEESLILRKELGDQRGIAMSLYSLGVIATHQGDYQLANNFLEECLEIYQQIGDKRGLAEVLENKGIVAVKLSDYAEAKLYFKESLELASLVEDQFSIANILANVSVLLNKTNKLPESLMLYTASKNLFDEIAASPSPSMKKEIQESTKQIRKSLGETRTRQIIEASKSLSLDKALDLAFNELGF